MVREREISSTLTKIFPPLKFVLPAGEALPQPPLSATLGQAQLNATEFCKQFNALSLAKYYSGVLINVSAIKKSDNSIDVQIGDIFLPFIFFQAIFSLRGKRKRRIYLEILYDIFKLYITFEKVQKNFISEQNVARTFFGTLRSCRFKIKFLFF